MVGGVHCPVAPQPFELRNTTRHVILDYGPKIRSSRYRPRRPRTDRTAWSPCLPTWTTKLPLATLATSVPSWLPLGSDILSPASHKGSVETVGPGRWSPTDAVDATPEGWACVLSVVQAPPGRLTRPSLLRRHRRFRPHTGILCSRQPRQAREMWRSQRDSNSRYRREKPVS